MADKKGLIIVTRLAPHLPALDADEGRFKQVLYNLLSNAVKFTPEHGRIETHVRLVGEAVEVMIADTGIGIAPENQERIFRQFQQVDSSSTRRHEGTGLGLALTQQLLELQGGSIWVESALGEGSRFYSRLPLCVPPTPPAPAIRRSVARGRPLEVRGWARRARRSVPGRGKGPPAYP